VRRSLFIARAVPATSREEVRKIVRQVRESMPDATHVCYAYRLMHPGDESSETDIENLEEYATDAGEPGGSAGRPMLNVLRQADLVDVVTWVGRYFGGTKLGVPGLMAAYAAAVQMSLDGVEPVSWVAMADLRLVLPYPLVDRVKDEVQRIAGAILSEDYSQQVTLDLKVPRNEAWSFVARLREWSRGDIQVSCDVIDLSPEQA
ncbi:MAG: YigZ family protein, partial [Fidelibacterota bacterium]